MRIFESLAPDRQAAVIGDIHKSTDQVRDYYLLVFLSCVIASLGLVLNSGAVIIGAMLIAPLMAPILESALALVRGDLRRLGRALVLVGLGASLAIGLSALLGSLVSLGGLNFLEELPTEILNRSEPTLFDLAIALAGGAAGAYALTQPTLSAALPGVAIATALMPPLCVVGIGLSQQRLDVSMGALLLFLANFVAIVFASSVIFTAVGFGPLALGQRREVVPRAVLLTSGLMLLVAVPLVGFLLRVAQDAQTNVAIRSSLITKLGEIDPASRLVSFEKSADPQGVQILATVRSPAPLTYGQAVAIQRGLAISLQQPVALKLLVVPVTVLDPLVPPPTATPPATPSPTRTPPAPAPTP
ncbi:MAG: DUF389 domain-containing protein [Candidatus Dormibacteraeota bacterium]|nr:DUF389 domain-containing protein [Candidatus Dormibacteraeota bacterium]